MSLYIGLQPSSFAFSLLAGEPDGLASDFAATTNFDAPIWNQTWSQKRASSVDTFSSPHTFYTNGGTSAKIVKTSSTGLGWSPHNLALRSQEFDNAAWPVTRSSVTANATTAPDGTATADKLMQTTASGTHSIAATSSITVVSGVSYTLSIYAQAAEMSWIHLQSGGGTDDSWFNVSTGVIGTVSNATASIENLGNGWYRCKATFTSTGTSAFPVIYLATGDNITTFVGSDNTSGVYIWGFQLNRGNIATTYIPTTSAAVIGLPISYGEGLLVEPAATNLAVQSQTFDNVAWTKGNNTITANQTTAPDGSLTADLMTCLAGSATHAVYLSAIATTANVAYTLSLYVKAGTARYIEIYTGTNATGWYAAVFDLVTATVTKTAGDTNGTYISSSITAVGNGWYRLVVTGILTIDTLYFPVVAIINTGTPTLATGSDGDVSWTAAGTETLYVWGYQLELGTVATSYIPTIAATVTRATDAPNVATSAYPHSATNGTFITWVTKRIVNATAADRIFSINNGTAAELMALDMVTGDTPDSFGLDITDTSVAQVVSTTTKSGSAIAAGNKVATFYKLNDSGVLADGSTEVKDTGVTLPTVTNLQLGYDSVTASRELNGFIQRLIYVPRRMTQNEMIVATGGGIAIFSITQETQDSGASGITFRSIVPITGGAATQIRCRFKAYSTSTLQVDHASIGISTGTNTDTTTTPVELLFGGVSGFTITNSAQVTSDWVNFASFTASDKLIVICDNHAGTGGDGAITRLGPAGSGLHYHSGASYNLATEPAGSTVDSAGSIFYVNLIEVR